MGSIKLNFHFLYAGSLAAICPVNTKMTWVVCFLSVHTGMCGSNWNLWGGVYEIL